MADTTAPETSVWIVGEMPDGMKILSNDSSGADDSEVWVENTPEEILSLAAMDTKAGEAVIGWYAEPEPFTATAPVEVIEEPVEPVEEPEAAVAAAVSDAMLTEIEASLDGYESLVTELLMAQMEDERFADEGEPDDTAVARPAPAAQHARVAAAARDFMDNINAAVTAAAKSKPWEKDGDTEDDVEPDGDADDSMPEDVPDDKSAEDEARWAKKKAKEAEIAAIEDDGASPEPPVDGEAMNPDGSLVSDSEGEGDEADAEDVDERLVSVKDRMAKLEEAITRLITMGQEDAEITEPDVSEESTVVDERDVGDM